jgi:hypothetical protein
LPVSRRTPDFLEIRLGFGLDRFRQFVEHVHGFMDPAALLPRCAELLLQRFPKTKCTIADGQLRRDGEATGFEIREQLTPGLGALAIAYLKADQLFLALRRRRSVRECIAWLDGGSDDPKTLATRHA